MKKLTVAIDTGAKNNGVYVVLHSNDRVFEKKAINIVFDEKSINFSKKSRRENRHKVRNIKRRKLAKRLLWEIFDKNSYSSKEQELIQGLLNNRGYTFLSTSSDFEKIEDITSTFLQEFIPSLKDLQTKEDFEEYLSNFEDEKELLETLNKLIEQTSNISKLKKADFSKQYKEYKDDYKQISSDLKILNDLFSKAKDEIQTGSKPRKRYLHEIKKQLETFDFIDDKERFYNIVGNISNLQLRVLRRYFNQKFDKSFDDKKLYKKLNDYFKRFHNKEFKNSVLNQFKKHSSSLEFLKSCDPILTIPPYEDMNNRNTYKCNSMLLKDEFITDSLKNSIDKILKTDEFAFLDEKSLSYNQKIQRILDINKSQISKELYPRKIFKYNKGNFEWYKDLLKEDYDEFKEFAQKFYSHEESIISGIYNNNFIFKKCNHNTPYKNNIKHTLLKPIYSYDFSLKEVDELIDSIKDTKGLKTALERVSKAAKEYQNSFYHIVEACFENQKCIDDKEVKLIVQNLSKNIEQFKDILKDKDTYFNTIEEVDKNNLKRVLNIFKQTYEILFQDINGFNKTCKSCTIENNIRSNPNNPIAKRLLSDVAKPIDGMLDMMLDRLAFEIVEEIESIETIENIEILLEQNRFEFEDGLSTIKRKKPKKRELKNFLEPKNCPYTGKEFDKGEYDHILPQSKELFNSKANLIYASVAGNKEKSNKRVYLQELSKEHLKAIFKTDNLDEIRSFISTNLEKIDEDNFNNFDNLKLSEQIAFRYALFFDENSNEFKKAKALLKKDKIRTFSNGTQKRLARLISQKLAQKFKKDIPICSKVFDAKAVSALRMELSFDKETGEVNELFKEKKQNSHSHCIDAMVVFALANKDIDFSDIYLKESAEKIVKKQTIKDRLLNKKKINSIASTETLFRENMIAVKFFKIFLKDTKFYYGESLKNSLEFKGFKKNMLKYCIEKNILVPKDKNSFEINKNTYHEILFDKKEVFENLNIFKKLDELRYTTQKKSIISLLDEFIKPKSNDSKKFLKELIGDTKITKKDDFNKNNLLAFFRKGSKTEHKKIRLKIDKTLEILSKILDENKELFLVEKEKSLSVDNNKLKEILSKSILFKKTHKPKRKVPREFSLPVKDTTERAFIVRRKDNHSNYIYQYLFANKTNSTRGFLNDYYIFKNHKNIIPAKIELYEKAFKSNNQ